MLKGVAILIVFAHVALAQCSMCRTAAASAQSAALDTAILILFLPAITLFGAILLSTIRFSEREEQMPDQLDDWLERFLADQGAVSGTVHRNENGTLILASAVNIPEKVRELVAVVPNGKGMAGLALQRGEPVHTCNLKEDDSGSVKPGAKAVDAQAAVAIPVRNETGSICAVVGIAFREERDWSEEELRLLTSAASGLPLS